MQRLRVNSRLADVIRALRAAEIEPMLLKGPVIGHWLYPGDPSVRPYVDLDLLVAPADRARAATVLIALGYEMQGEAMPNGDEPHARTLERHLDFVAVVITWMCRQGEPGRSRGNASVAVVNVTL